MALKRLNNGDAGTAAKVGGNDWDDACDLIEDPVVFTSVAKGAVPASAGGTTKFLRADGSFQVPADLVGGTLTNIAGLRGVTTANFPIRANPNATDATERSTIIQALNAGTDAFLDVLKVVPNGANPTVVSDYPIDIKALAAAPASQAGYGRMYVKTIDANNEGCFIKQKVNGAIVEVQL